MLKGYRTYTILGSGFVIALGLLVWCHFEPGLLSESLQGTLEGVVVTALVGLGLRSVTTAPPGKAG